MHSKNIHIFVLFCLITFTQIGCLNSQSDNNPDTDNNNNQTAEPISNDNTPAEAPSTHFGFLDFEEITSIDIKITGNAMFTVLPEEPCLEITAAPLVLEDHLVFPMHIKTLGNKDCQTNDLSESYLLAVSVKDGKARALADAVSGEGSPTLANNNTIIQPLVSHHSEEKILIWQRQQSQFVASINAGIDSSVLWDSTEEKMVFGTVNPPFPVCQGNESDLELNKDCGALFSHTLSGSPQEELGIDTGFRAWVVGSPVSDGTFYYVGTGQDNHNDETDTQYHGCQLLKLNKKFEIIASYDDGDAGCYQIGNLESAIIGEPVLVDDFVWIQHLGSTSSKDSTSIVKLHKDDLSVSCRAEIPSLNSRESGHFYQAPVIDRNGSAYVTMTGLSDEEFKTMLVKIAPDCSYKILHMSGSTNKASSPTLAEDKYVMYAVDGKLYILSQQGQILALYPLGSTAPVFAGPVVHESGVSVVSSDGVISTFFLSNLNSYGTDPWPRFRQNNAATAMQK